MWIMAPAISIPALQFLPVNKLQTPFMQKNATLTRRMLSIAAGCFFVLSAFAQLTGKEISTVKKSEKYYSKGQYDKAIATLNKVLLPHETIGDLWGIMYTYQSDRYNAQKNKEMNDLMKQLLGASKKSGTITLNLDNNLSSQYYNEFVQSCYRATLCSDVQENAAVLLRAVYIDDEVDTAVPKEAKAKFDEGEQEFQKQNYSKAAQCYQAALALDSNYYKAGLYIGDSYWNDNQPEQALKYFKEAIRKKPNMLEPRKYLVDAYISMGDYEHAYTECVEAIIVHPDAGMFIKMQKIAKNLGKSFDRHWMPRTDYVNNPNKEQSVPTDGSWKLYREAKTKIAPYCSSNGVIEKSNSLTKQKYLEAYSWEYMLTNSSSTQGEFDFARKMMNAGYLDCYVFISMYHVGLRDQYDHFVKDNQDRIREYFKLYLLSK